MIMWPHSRHGPPPRMIGVTRTVNPDDGGQAGAWVALPLRAIAYPIRKPQAVHGSSPGIQPFTPLPRTWGVGQILPRWSSGVGVAGTSCNGDRRLTDCRP